VDFLFFNVWVDECQSHLMFIYVEFSICHKQHLCMRVTYLHGKENIIKISKDESQSIKSVRYIFQFFSLI